MKAKKPMKPVTWPDILYLRAADGWTELGNYTEAQTEIHKIDPLVQVHPDVLEVRWRIHAHAKDWGVCAEIATLAVERDRSRPDSWIHRSFALHALGRTEEALNLLQPAAEIFLNNWTVFYNLACYCAQLGKFEDSKSWFKKAIVLNERDVQRVALDDPDLRPLWDSMCDDKWMREK